MEQEIMMVLYDEDAIIDTPRHEAEELCQEWQTVSDDFGCKHTVVTYSPVGKFAVWMADNYDGVLHFVSQHDNIGAAEDAAESWLLNWKDLP